MAKKFQLPIILSIIFCLCQNQELHSLMIWKKDFIETESYWTLFSSSFTHTNIKHLIMNLSVLFVLYLSYEIKNKDFICLILFALLIISITLIFTPYNSYAGFSGILYALMSFLFLKNALKKDWISFIALLLLTLKLIVDFIIPSNFTISLINANIANEIHVAGYMSGLLYSLTKLKLK